MNHNRSEKEIAIYNGLISLIKNGANPYLIKVQEIADAANVGKGTIYDYFKTKEEAISKAVIFSIHQEIETAYGKICSKPDFKSKFYELLSEAVKCLHNNLSVFNVLISVGGAQQFYNFLHDEQYDMSFLKASVNDVIEHILQAGYKEGVITIRESAYYRFIAVHGAISGFSHYVHQKDRFPGTTLKEAKDAAYHLLVKALN